MKLLRNLLDKTHPMFDKGGKFERLYPLYEAADTFLYTPGMVARGLTHIRDALDLKRMMSIVVVALVPCVLMALWNTGYQANLILSKMEIMGLTPTFDWHHELHTWLGFGHDPSNLLDNVIYGALFFFPVYIVTLAAGGTAELIFSVIRKHEINEGFLVTSLLFPLVLPPTIPLWQVATGILFGVVIGKEIFGGTGRNFLNPALTGRTYLYFAHAGDISGDKVWTAVDGYSGATALGELAAAQPNQFEHVTETLQNISTTTGEMSITWWDSFWGCIPGSMGETSVAACLLGALVLIATGIGSWRIMAGCCIGAFGFSSILYLLPSSSNAMFGIAPWWHFVIGGFAFGTVFMATDPVSASMTETGKWIYGILIGVMTIMVRSLNPAFPEGIMLAILFGNVFAPLIDYCVVQANIKRRAVRYVS